MKLANITVLTLTPDVFLRITCASAAFFLDTERHEGETPNC